MDQQQMLAMRDKIQDMEIKIEETGYKIHGWQRRKLNRLFMERQMLIDLLDNLNRSVSHIRARATGQTAELAGHFLVSLRIIRQDVVGRLRSNGEEAADIRRMDQQFRPGAMSE